jgi:hypothetical protein
MLWDAQVQYRLFDAINRAGRLPDDFFKVRFAYYLSIDQAAKGGELGASRLFGHFKAVLNLEISLQHQFPI